MIEVIHVPEKEAVATAAHIIKALGPDAELSKMWIKAVYKLGYNYRPDWNYNPNSPSPLFRKPV